MKLTLHDRLFRKPERVKAALGWLIANPAVVAQRWGDVVSWNEKALPAFEPLPGNYPFFDMILEGPDDLIVEFRLRFL